VFVVWSFNKYFVLTVRVVVTVIAIGNCVWWGHLRERDHLEDPGVGCRIILRWFFRKWDVGAWTGLIRLRIGTGGGAFVNAAMNIRVP
jgi:hypothetical protein